MRKEKNNMEVNDQDSESNVGTQFIAPTAGYPPGVTCPPDRVPLPYTGFTNCFVYGRGDPGGRPATGRPVNDDPATGHPVNDDSATDGPTNDGPANDHPATDDPATGHPVNDDSATDDPATDRPTTGRPGSLHLDAPTFHSTTAPAICPAISPGSLHLDAPTFRSLLQLQGPSLGLWRAAEIAALREQVFEPPVLDLGCGDGLVTSMVLSKVEVGLDPDTKVLERAARHGIYERFEATPAERMQLPDGSIGTVLSNSVLEHLPQLDAVLEAVVRVLRPGGQLIFTVPTEAFSNWLVLPFTRYAAWRNHQLCHLNLWTTECWKEHLHRVGLQVEQVRTYLGHRWVSIWDTLELSQQIWIARKRLFGMIWRRIPPSLMDRLALRAAQLNLAAPAPGGGRLIVARKL